MQFASHEKSAFIPQSTFPFTPREIHRHHGTGNLQCFIDVEVEGQRHRILIWWDGKEGKIHKQKKGGVYLPTPAMFAIFDTMRPRFQEAALHL